MPENTVAAPPTPMTPDDIVDAFAYIGALQADDIDTACEVARLSDGESKPRMLLDVAERVIIPVTAVDEDCDEGPCAHSFLAAALGRLLLEVLSVDRCCPVSPVGIAQYVIRFAEEILTEERGDVADVLRRLEAAGMEQAMEAHSVDRTTA
ncbi:hypothetical protein ABT096_37340 [Streptomyces sp. NPDC002561]|uniref:hypothetical protein n=1 Tax=unclassified Streptomyces TaxID=2593676 RepID=UPI0011E6F5FC|nr:hypothetical protein [Streptomyces sp. sk2.1]TXS60797.1 hypothetical protein EAO76_41850 [Streptomyces sp. sk2.1]